MKTVLIVEDEKMIRQGIKTMIQRSGVPVEVIVECNNGETALNILKEQEVDVMFTDIRMPKMDGIELVHSIQELDRQPLIAVVSGYDDFSYAVDMMRHGVREYILKPVEREKITQILIKFEQELQSQKQQSLTEKRIGHQQIKYLMMTEQVPQAELELLRDKYETSFFTEGYVVCVFADEVEIEDDEAIISLNNIGECNITIVEQKNLPMLLKNELEHINTGVSSVHHGLVEMKQAYDEAYIARKRAFCMEREIVCMEDAVPVTAERIRQQALKFLDEQALVQRVQLIGTDRTEEMAGQWSRFFDEVRRERISPAEFEQGMMEFLDETEKIYRNAILDSDRESLEQCRRIYSVANITEYESYFMDWILELHNRINSQPDSNKNEQKIKQAVEYIQENYNKDLNMAVVSNHISMNYSLFSFSFKQYTGSNFVNYLKDIRIKEAKKLLTDTDMKVIEISQTVGYDNEKHFMKIFKTSCGVSPSEFRKNMNME